MLNISRLFTKTEFTVAYRFSDRGLMNETEIPFRSIKTDENRWYADPFIIKHNEEYYVFMEVFMKERGYAGIGYSVLVNNELTEPKMVIETGYHMSFPFVFTKNGKYYMVPETCARNKIQIFECVDFPEKWEPVWTIAEGKAFYDSVLFEMCGEPYMFTSVATKDVYGSMLSLIKLDLSSGGFWTAKKEKKISTDYTVSREAGKMLREGDYLYRVAQDCSNSDYGHALNFLRVENADYENYSESVFKTINVSDIKTEKHIMGIAGIHTYNREETFEVIDLKLCTFSLKSTFLKLKIAFDMILQKIRFFKTRV